MTKIRCLYEIKWCTSTTFIWEYYYRLYEKTATKRPKSPKQDVGSNSSSKNNKKLETPSQIISPLKVVTRDFSGTNIENILHLSNDIIISLGKDHKIQAINKSGCKALGYPQKKLSEKTGLTVSLPLPCERAL